MRRLIVGLSMLIVLGEAKAAELTCPKPEVSLGTLKTGPAISHRFDLHAPLASPILIEGIHGSCGCARYHLSHRRLEAGQGGQLHVELNTLTATPGENEWTFRVRYRVEREGALQELTLRLRAQVVREVMVQPPQLALSTSGVAEQELRVTDGRARPLRLLRTVTSSPHLEVERLEEGPGVVRLKVRLGPGAPIGEAEETITLYTDDSEYAELRVPVRIAKRPRDDISLSPDSVAWRLGEGDTRVSALVQLRARDGGEVRIERVESPHPALDARWSPGLGPIATLRVTLAADKAPPSGQAMLHIHLAQPAGRIIRLPVAWTHADPAASR